VGKGNVVIKFGSRRRLGTQLEPEIQVRGAAIVMY